MVTVGTVSFISSCIINDDLYIAALDANVTSGDRSPPPRHTHTQTYIIRGQQAVQEHLRLAIGASVSALTSIVELVMKHSVKLHLHMLTLEKENGQRWTSNIFRPPCILVCTFHWGLPACFLLQGTLKLSTFRAFLPFDNDLLYCRAATSDYFCRRLIFSTESHCIHWVKKKRGATGISLWALLQYWAIINFSV